VPDENNADVMIQQIKERKQLYQDVFESPNGKKVLEDLSRHAFINKTTLNENSNRMAFSEGMRSLVLHIQNMMKIDIEKTTELIKKQSEVDNV